MATKHFFSHYWCESYLKKCCWVVGFYTPDALFSLKSTTRYQADRRKAFSYGELQQFLVEGVGQAIEFFCTSSPLPQCSLCQSARHQEKCTTDECGVMPLKKDLSIFRRGCNRHYMSLKKINNAINMSMITTPKRRESHIAAQEKMLQAGVRQTLLEYGSLEPFPGPELSANSKLKSKRRVHSLSKLPLLSCAE